MPNGNGTGPMGMGPMTGRGMGNCAGTAGQGGGRPGRLGGFGRGRGFFGRGGGFGRGAGRRFYSSNANYDAPLTKEEEQAVLKRDAEFLRAELDAVEKRMKETNG